MNYKEYRKRLLNIVNFDSNDHVKMVQEIKNLYEDASHEFNMQQLSKKELVCFDKLTKKKLSEIQKKFNLQDDAKLLIEINWLNI